MTNKQSLNKNWISKIWLNNWMRQQMKINQTPLRSIWKKKHSKSLGLRIMIWLPKTTLWWHSWLKSIKRLNFMKVRMRLKIRNWLIKFRISLINLRRLSMRKESWIDNLKVYRTRTSTISCPISNHTWPKLKRNRNIYTPLTSVK